MLRLGSAGLQQLNTILESVLPFPSRVTISRAILKDSPMITGHTQSQDHAVLFHPCGVFNVFRMGEARHRMATIYHGCKPQIVGREEALDIDTPEDFEFLSAIAPAFKKRLFS